MEEILTKALDKMPQQFSSNEFSERAIKLGYPRQMIARGRMGLFLHKNCVQSAESKRMWEKKKDEQTLNFNVDLETAIGLLKMKGYKIMKPKTDWEEI
jgi:hypothetical protein